MNVTFDTYWCYIHPQTPNDIRIAVEYLNAVKGKKGYRIPKNLPALRELLKVFPALLKNVPFINEGKRLKQEQETLMWYRKHPLYDPDIPNPRNLRPYQSEDVDYLTRIECAGIFNEPRTGKTPTVITLIKELGTYRNLIVVPASLIWNWAEEFKKWHNIDVFVYTGTLLARTKQMNGFELCKGPSVLIISRDMLKLWKNSPKVDVTIVDEAHFLRNYKSAQSKAVFKLSKKGGRLYALTGTPTVKHPSDIWGILHFLCPSQFPSYWQFCDRYFEQFLDFMGHNQVGSPKKHRVNELQEMIALISTQRKRKEVMKWLPEKQRSTFSVRLENKQLKLYDEMVNFFCTEDGGTEIDTQNVISQLMRLRQLCLDPRLLGFDTEGAKTIVLLEYLENHHEPIVIMSMFTSYLKLLKPLIEKLDLKVGFIHGEMSNQAKATAASDFQLGRTDVLLCNIISAGYGFTLDTASVVAFMDKAYNPSENEQAEDRVCPTTEDRNHKHEIITFCCRDTVDDRIDAILSQKKSLTDYINEGGREALRNLMKG